MRGYPSLRIAGVADSDVNRALRFGAFHGLPVYQSVNELMANQRVVIVLNLTNPRSHYTVSKTCLEAGKHVYSEKPLAMDYPEARELVELAEARGLHISSAPCSLLGECAQTMWKAVRENLVGRVRAVYAEMDDGPIHRMAYRKWFNESGAPWPYQDEFEVGCTMEHAGYSLTWLTALFGPAKSVTAFSSLQIADKEPGIAPERLAPDFSVAAIQLASGVVARLTCSIVAPEDHGLRVLGDEGVLYTPDVWRYDFPVYRRRWITVRRRTLLSPLRKRIPMLLERGRKLAHDDRGRGVAELAAALAEGRQSRLSARFALHVTELSLAIQQAGTSGGAYEMKTSFDPITPMSWGQ